MITKDSLFQAIEHIDEIDDIEILYTNCHLGSFTEILFYVGRRAIELDDLNGLVNQLLEILKKMDDSVLWDKNLLKLGVSKSICVTNGKITISFYYE